MRLSAGRVVGIAALCLAGACMPTPVPRPVASPAPLPRPAFRSGWGPAQPPLRIMPLGDSITYGVGSTDGAGYRGRLEWRLRATGALVDFVGSRDAGPPGLDGDNEGHSGWTISRMARRVDRWLTTYRPDVVLVHIGTNDVRINGHRNGAARRLGVLLNRIRRDRPAAHILVAMIAGSRLPDLQRWIDAYNRGVRRIVAARHDPLLHLVDQAAVRAARLHPDDAGYATMADNWFTALRTAVPAIRAQDTSALGETSALSGTTALRELPALRGTPALRETSVLGGTRALR